MTWILGNKIRINIFGESHGPAIGGVVEGLASGIKIDMGELEKFMLGGHQAGPASQLLGKKMIGQYFIAAY